MAPPKPTPALIAQVRAGALEAYEQNKELYDTAEIERIKTEDLFVERFLTREQCDPVAAIELISCSLRYSKRHGLANIKESEFTPELLSLVQFQGRDKQGNHMIYLRYKTAKKILKRNSKEGEKIKRLALYYFKKIEDETKGKYTFVVDARSLALRDLVKYANKDLAALGLYLITALVRYTPDPVGTLLLYEVPRFFSAVLERIIKLTPDEHAGKVKIVRKKDLEKVVAKEEMPDYMGGKLVVGGKSSADDEVDSGDEGNEINNLEDMERALDEEDSKL